MTFTSTEFLVFLVIFSPVYFLTLHLRQLNNVVLVVGGLIFYGWHSPYFVGLLLISAITDFTLGLIMGRTDAAVKRRLLLVLSVVVNIGFLGYFKYFNFLVGVANDLSSSIGRRPFDIYLDVVLPAGISFYTFQSLSYTIDVYRRKLEPRKSLLDYLAFVSFFPHLVAGPIMRATALLPQVEQQRRFDLATAQDGARQILYGFAKKVLVADNLAQAVDVAYASPSHYSGASLAIATIFFTFQIYADFSAYSDIAVGLAKILGFRLIRNFYYPYFSLNIVDFWRRWHVSLTSWFRDYVFFSMGGSRVPTGRWVFNIFTVFLISGLWHGAAVTFLVWGFVHALLYCIVTLWHHRKPIPTPRSVWGTAASLSATFLAVCLAWVFFRAQSASDALMILAKFANPREWYYEVHYVVDNGVRLGAVMILIMVVVEWMNREKEHPFAIANWPSAARRLVYLATIVGMALFGAGYEAHFIYFQF